MKKFPIAKIFMLIALISLGAVFLFPLWQIHLDAAQFPGGLDLHIWINKISGSDENIIQNINILNHYIGMKPIHPDAIPELKYFPVVCYGIIFLGLIAIWINKPSGYLSWCLLMIVLGALGIYDFYLWLYDYGHNLDPMAPIKIEGMAFMPPVFGEKDLLNFYVKSYPHLGGLFLFMSILFSGMSFLKARKS